MAATETITTNTSRHLPLWVIFTFDPAPLKARAKTNSAIRDNAQNVARSPRRNVYGRQHFARPTSRRRRGRPRRPGLLSCLAARSGRAHGYFSHHDPALRHCSSSTYPSALNSSLRLGIDSGRPGRAWRPSVDCAVRGFAGVQGTPHDHSRAQEPRPRRGDAPLVSSRRACRVPQIAKDHNAQTRRTRAMQTQTVKLSRATHESSVRIREGS